MQVLCDIAQQEHQAAQSRHWKERRVESRKQWLPAGAPRWKSSPSVQAFTSGAADQQSCWEKPLGQNTDLVQPCSGIQLQLLRVGVSKAA